MSAQASPLLPGGVEAIAITPLLDGWEAIGVPPGSADRSLTRLEDSLLAFTAPGTAASALRSAGSLPPAERDLDAEDWWFRCRFTAAPVEPGEEAVLRFDGLATLADVWLNGEHVLTAENMHVPHEVSVAGRLTHENELVVCCRALEPELTVKRPRPRWRTRLVPHQGLRWFRTSLTGRIPAFAPGPAPVGPWRPVSLVRRRRVAVEDITVRARLDEGRGVVSVGASLRPLGETVLGSVSVRIDGPSGSSSASLDSADDSGRVEGDASLDDPVLWWPHTHGDPALYDVTLLVEVGEEVAAVPCGRVGFRSLEAASEPGLALSLNGVPLFSRGGSLLPDAVTVDHTGGDLRAMLEQCRDAGMNMVRLSGVGTYGSGDLYDVCDELGLLVWQDFPFANLDYPIDDGTFRTSVTREAAGFLAAAGSHPSLVVLCGSSEIEQQVGMLGLDPALGRGPLFDELLPGLVREHGVDAHYLPSTPTGGELPFRPNRGVAHYFGVGAYRRPLEDARRAEVRFASECLAFANVPEDEVLAALGGARVHDPTWKAGVPRDAGAGWDFDDVRDHYLRELFGLDPGELRAEDPERYLAVSRVVTGEVMAATLGEWRRQRSPCRGALLWTLNDVLPGAGWGVLDFRGRPKAAYWYVRRALLPLAVWMTDEGTNGVAVHVANDTPRPVNGRLVVALHRRDGQAVAEESLELELPPHDSREHSVEGVLGRFADAGHAYRFGPPEHATVTAALCDDDGLALSAPAVLFPLGLPTQQDPLVDLGLEASASPGDGDSWTVVARSTRAAYSVAVEAPGFDTSDNHFTLSPGRPQSLTLVPVSAEASPSAVRLRPLNATSAAPLRLP